MYCREPKQVNDIVNEYLWNNAHILIEAKPVQHIEWAEHRINIIADLLNNEGTILAKDALQLQYNLVIKQMDYNSLIHSIPK